MDGEGGPAAQRQGPQREARYPAPPGSPLKARYSRFRRGPVRRERGFQARQGGFRFRQRRPELGRYRRRALRTARELDRCLPQVFQLAPQRVEFGLRALERTQQFARAPLGGAELALERLVELREPRRDLDQPRELGHGDRRGSVRCGIRAEGRRRGRRQEGRTQKRGPYASGKRAELGRGSPSYASHTLMRISVGGTGPARQTKSALYCLA